MYILRIEHPVPNYEAWKSQGFDSDPLDREGSGVKYHQIMRPVDDEKYVMIDLGFETIDEAKNMLQRLEVMWGDVKEKFGWSESPKATIVEITELKKPKQ